MEKRYLRTEALSQRNPWLSNLTKLSCGAEIEGDDAEG